jgi:hypothetical protein
VHRSPSKSQPEVESIGADAASDYVWFRTFNFGSIYVGLVNRWLVAPRGNFSPLLSLLLRNASAGYLGIDRVEETTWCLLRSDHAMCDASAGEDAK